MTSNKEQEYEKLMRTDYKYPDPSDPNIQLKTYKKREFYYHKIKDRPNLENYSDIKEYRDKICSGQMILREHQAMLSNFINPNTPYKSLLIFHGLGTGKTCAAISIAENFKEMVQRYNTKIHVLVSGPLIRENWKNEILTCTGETYIKYQDKSIHLDKSEVEKIEKLAIANVMQFYRFMSYRSFYKRVLGEKIVDKKTVDGSKVKVSYKKTEEGEFERDIAVDRIYNLNNTILIVDEAHNLTGNAYGEALKLIISNSLNLRVILLSATPMKNLADDVIELLNFIRPHDSQIERDKVFTTEKIHLIDFKPGGIEYLKKMARGYVSHLRGADPLIFAKRVDVGEVPKGLLFTKVIKCKMLPFQKKIYETAIKEVKEDSLDRKSEAVANFAFPILGKGKELTGTYGREGIKIVKNQLKSNYELLNKKIASDILKTDVSTDLIYLTDGKNITGNILHIDHLENFSTKFYTVLTNLNQLVYGKKGPKIAFVYSNLVKVGIELFHEILLQNGYLEFQENPSNYQIKASTICYFCGKKYDEHSKNILNTIHDFYPASFITITGKSSEESAEFIPEDKTKYLKTVFNNIDNKNGKYIKFVLGSKVMNEGISLKNVAEVHILDVYFNLGKVDQTVGRAIRQCSHYQLMNELNKFPEVLVYKYAISMENKLSTEEELYQKAELKYLLIKKTERMLKEVAIDCPLNVNGNMFNEEMEQYENCDKKIPSTCPQICDYTKCYYVCDDEKLNYEYYDPNRKMYKKIPKDKLDYSTFTNTLARNEIEYSKRKIKEMYLRKWVYNIHNIIEYVKRTYDDEKKDLFDNFFVFKALDELIPITENDFNNFKDTIIDKYNRSGYLIYRGKEYIFQPFDQNENISMYYRTSYDKKIINNISLYNYLKSIDTTHKLDLIDNIFDDKKDTIISYDFDSTMDYYDNRNEFDYVGIIDREYHTRKSKDIDDLKDVFKIREKRSKILDKRRGTGIPSLKGAVCFTSKNKKYLEKIAKKINIQFDEIDTRENICSKIKEKMLDLEKYSLGKNKITYIMIPANHPIYPFPYNLEDRKNLLIEKINKRIKYKMNLSVKSFAVKKGTTYDIIIKDNPKLSDFHNFLKSLDAEFKDNNWIIHIH